jgi:uncharacterized membrane protein
MKSKHDFILCLLLALLTLILDMLPYSLRALVGLFIAFIAPGYVLLKVINQPTRDIIDLTAFSIGLSSGVLLFIAFITDILFELDWYHVRYSIVLYFILSGVVIAQRKEY